MNHLYFEKLANFERINEPVQFSVPFKQGEVYESNLSNFFIGQNNRHVPCQTKPLSFWSDNSVKWLSVYALVNLPANAGAVYEYGFSEEKNSQSVPPIIIEEFQDKITVSNGCFTALLNNISGLTPFESFSCPSTKFTVDGPYICYDKNKHSSLLSSPWTLEEKGNVMAHLKSEGRHVCDTGNDREESIRFIIDLFIYANTPWLEISYKIINSSNVENETDLLSGIKLEKIAVDFIPSGTAARLLLATSNYETNIRESTGQPLSYTIDADHIIYEANEHIPQVFYGTFFADWQDANGEGLCVTQHQAYQNFPKGFKADKDRISMEILPKEYGGLNLPGGMGKTHSFFLHFHDGHQDAIEKRSLMLQLRDRPYLDPMVYKESGIFPHLFPADRINDVEEAFVSLIDSIGEAYGMLHYGDFPDGGYTLQGRGSGEPVWTNNEYDFPFAAMQLYIRNPERRFFEYFAASARHWQDVDICHFSKDPLRHGAQIIHSAGHVSGYVEISHEWVEGLFAYYHMTGDKFAYDTAIGIGRNIMTHLEQERYRQKGEINARETGWALRALCALYTETNDSYWLSKADFIVSHFEQWTALYGGWLAPYTGHTAIRVPFMIGIAIGSLMRYYRINPRDDIRQMIIAAADDLIQNCLLENGLFYYKELPSLKRSGTNTILLEAMASAYELTGDVKYLEAGIETFKKYLSGKGGGYGKGKRKVKDGVLQGSGSPKGFGQSFYPVMYYYFYISESGIYKN